ncbi:hypothetical protein, partial [Thermodesulfitimonas autotrophica]|uniref:hypothetical protein n=1 Tax=Thermodesulfitimonas autotrophica TaxID=1894989 RepID=UPI002FE377EE
RQEFAARQLAVNALTAGYSLAYYQGVFRRPEKVRILFIMNRYTPNIGESIYADDNCIYDCMAACQELGIEHQLYTHKSDIHWCSYPASLLQQIRDFQPHLLFQVNHHK